GCAQWLGSDASAAPEVCPVVVPLRRAACAVVLAFPSPAFAQEKPAEPTRVEEGAAKRTVRIHGTAVALDQAGAARADADGRLQIYHFVDGVIEVPVRRGTWEAFCTTEARFTIRDLELGGRSVSLLPHSFAPPLRRSFDLKGPWIADHVVHVVDEKTG